MSEIKQNEGIAAGKVRVGRVPDGLDLSDLQYLQHRDLTRVAKEVGLTRAVVSRVRNGRSFNVKVLAALLKRARENKTMLEAVS